MASTHYLFPKWNQSLGLCLNINVPILVGISDVIPPRVTVPQKDIQEVMDMWNCNRFMKISIHNSNSVTRAFNYLSNNYIDRIHRGCAVGHHVQVIPVGDSIKKFFSFGKLF